MFLTADSKKDINGRQKPRRKRSDGPHIAKKTGTKSKGYLWVSLLGIAVIAASLVTASVRFGWLALPNFTHTQASSALPSFNESTQVNFGSSAGEVQSQPQKEPLDMTGVAAWSVVVLGMICVTVVMAVGHKKQKDPASKGVHAVPGRSRYIHVKGTFGTMQEHKYTKQTRLRK